MSESILARSVVPIGLIAVFVAMLVLNKEIRVFVGAGAGLVTRIRIVMGILIFTAIVHF